MRNLRPIACAAGIAILAASITSGHAAEPLKVVATFSVLADIVSRVGGEHVAVTPLVGPDGDAHSFEPTPQSARATAAAGLVVVNGLGFEGWIDRLIAASGYKGLIATASDGITPLTSDGEEHASEHDGDADEHHEPVDPHAWQAVENAETYVKNIATALCGAQPEACTDFQANAAAYTQDLRSLDAEIKAGFAAIPAEQRKVITSHDAFGYFAAAYGITILAPQGVSTESEASAADVAKLIGQVREQGVTALFVENIADPRLIEQIGRETGVTPGGSLYSDALSPPDGQAPSYIAMMRHNASLLQSAMSGM